MTNFRSRPDGSHYPIQKRKSTTTFQVSTIHLNKNQQFKLTELQEKLIYRYIEAVLMAKDDSWVHGKIPRTFDGKSIYFFTEGWFPNCLTDVKEEYNYEKSKGYQGSLRKYATDRARKSNERATLMNGYKLGKHLKEFKFPSSGTNDGTNYITGDIYIIEEEPK